MKTTPKPAHCHIEIRQRGRLNHKFHLVCMGGRVVFVNAQDGTKAGAERLAARIGRLVVMWRAA